MKVENDENVNKLESSDSKQNKDKTNSIILFPKRDKNWKNPFITFG